MSTLDELRAERDRAARAGDHGTALVLNDRIHLMKGTTMARPLQKTFSPTHPYVIERRDQEDGAIHYEIWDHRPDTYRRLCTVTEDYNDDSEDGSPDRGQSLKDANMIVRALNLMNGMLP